MATNRVLTAHIVVEFSEGDGEGAFVEVDDRPDGYNNGLTSFTPGSDVFLLLFKPTGYSVFYKEASSGALSKVADTKKAVEEIMSFPNEDGATVRYPIADSFTYQWMGNNLGAILPATEFSVSLPSRPIDPGTQKPVPEYRIGVARARYNSNCEVWKLSGVAADVEQALCFFVLKKDNT